MPKPCKYNNHCILRLCILKLNEGIHCVHLSILAINKLRPIACTQTLMKMYPEAKFCSLKSILVSLSLTQQTYPACTLKLTNFINHHTALSSLPPIPFILSSTLNIKTNLPLHQSASACSRWLIISSLNIKIHLRYADKPSEHSSSIYFSP